MGVLRRLLPALIVTIIVGGLAAIGIVGVPGRPERFDAKTVVYEPADDGGVRVTEYVDIDFGTTDRHGYERVLRTDFGWPLDVAAYSSTVSSEVSSYPEGTDYVIRVGDPEVTVSGRHRFVLAYTLPLADLSEGRSFDLSVIDPGEELETGRFTVVLNGFRLDDALCSVGDWGDVGGCVLVDNDTGQHVMVEPLAAGDGINVSGQVAFTSSMTDVDAGDPFPPVDQPTTWWRALLIVVATLGSSVLIVRWAIRSGSNEVAALDAAGAAFPVAGAPTARVTDDELMAMATIEFAPPAGVSPWEGRVVLDEGVGDSTVSAWLSTQLGAGVLDIVEDGSDTVIRSGESRASADVVDEPLLSILLPGGSPRTVGRRYDATFAATWTTIRSTLNDRVTARQWWTKPLRRQSGRADLLAIFSAVILTMTVIVGSIVATTSGGPGARIAGNVVVTALAAVIIASISTLMRVSGDMASRTAAGSAVFLSTESFRRFLAASEGRHVQEALDRGVLREYTAWAAALGEAEAWERAARSLGNAAVLATVSSTAYMHHHHSTFSSATTQPSSSGGGGGGGAGGGGGGGSSGSW